MISIDEVLAILREMREESETFFNSPSATDAHAFGYARGFKHAVRQFDVLLQARVESLSQSLGEEL